MPFKNSNLMTRVRAILQICIHHERRSRELVGDGPTGLQGSCHQLTVRKETATMDDLVEPLRASKQRDVETEREAALEVRKEWAKEDAEYRELLRIAKTVEEARREIDVQTLQDLIDPEHKMNGGDWVSFWEDRGFSGDSEPSDVWGRAFADGAARLFQKVRSQL
jgi:hypothetical protein